MIHIELTVNDRTVGVVVIRCAAIHQLVVTEDVLKLNVIG